MISISVLLRFILSVRLCCGPGSVPGLSSHDRPLGHGRGGRCLSPPSITPLKPLYNPLTQQGLRQQHQELRTNWLCSWRSVCKVTARRSGSLGFCRIDSTRFWSLLKYHEFMHIKLRKADSAHHLRRRCRPPIRHSLHAPCPTCDRDFCFQCTGTSSRRSSVSQQRAQLWLSALCLQWQTLSSFEFAMTFFLIKIQPPGLLQLKAVI